MNAVPPALAVLATSSTKSTSSGGVEFIIFLVAIGLVGYFLLLRPQQQRARRQREAQSEIGVGDEVLTVGGIIGTVIEIDSERVTIVTGVDTDGPGTPTRMVLVRNAIARKMEAPTEPVESGGSGHPGYGGVPEGDDGATEADDGAEGRADGSKEAGDQ
jgi:preprotein translocase subunit YajC